MAGYQPVPYHQDADETAACPGCGRMQDTDAKYCDQCDHPMDNTTDYEREDDENVQCPECDLFNDDDAEFCDQCGIRLEGRPDVTIASDEPDEETDSQQMNSKHRRDNLIRARIGQGVELRSDGEGGPSQIFGIFSEFNTWYEVDSFWEGHFLERVLPGAFAQTMVDDRAGMRVLYDHGYDPSLGNKPLGPIADLRESKAGAEYVVDLLDTDYNRDFVIPALSGKLINGESVGSQLGASFRFQVQEDQWNHKPKASKTNPDALPERSIIRTRVFEFGPVTFPANAGATAGVRSLSDEWMARLVTDPQFSQRFAERVGRKVAQRVVASVPADLRAALERQEVPTAAQEQRLAVLRRRAQAILATSA